MVGPGAGHSRDPGRGELDPHSCGLWLGGRAETEGRARPCPGAFLVLVLQCVSVTWTPVWISFLALCMDPGLPGVCPDVILALGGLLLCWKPHFPRPRG